ncbi:hypothetical protein DY000_02059277 [Brassica cretica]|uniref:Uncharacterized protein n=1 Tax=Brassica cretica TaxID=69181 RepID=A0ABQ7AQZ2_BRACR|nr:hypothetical protein DY000_02059277 [Brassica cretica]
MTFNSLQLSSQVRWLRTVKMNAKIACASVEFVSEIADWPTRTFALGRLSDLRVRAHRRYRRQMTKIAEKV